jgi:DNA polymerase III delta prime subunit
MNAEIDEKDVSREVAEARARVRVSGLPAALARIDAGSFGTTSLNLEMLDALVRAAATAIAVMKAPRLEGAGPVFFSYVFAQEAVDRLLSIGGPEKPDDPSGSLRADQYRDIPNLKTPDALFTTVLKDCAGFLKFYGEHPDSGKRVSRDEEALTCLRSYFHLLGATLKKLGSERIEARVETPRQRYDGWSVSPTAIGETSNLMPIGLDDIVGNEEYLKGAKRLARDVAGFDMKAGKNPKKVRNQILFVLGSPGCGKTVTAHAVLRYFLDLCEKHEVPAKTRIIRRTDWASSYQNQSANRLLEIFRDEVFSADAVVGVYWADIDTAFSARGGTELRQEEKSNLGTLFGILDGTIGPKNGKWFLICDANTMHMDEAMISRLAQTPLQALGPTTPEHFVRLLRDIKLRGRDRWLPISEDDWAAIGKRCVDEGLSGRSVDAIAGRVLTAMEDFEEPDEYFSLPFEKKQKLIDELSVKVDSETIQSFLTDHLKFEKAAQEKSEEERFNRRVEEIRLHLSAQRAALKPPSQSNAPGAVREGNDRAPGANDG